MDIIIFKVTENSGFLISSPLNFVVNLTFIVTAHYTTRRSNVFSANNLLSLEIETDLWVHKLYFCSLDHDPAILPWC